MLIQETVQKTGLTKKAIAYYEEQRLISPCVLENGYRDFSAEEIGRLEKIGVLRKLALSTEEIREVLEDGNGEALKRISVRQELKLQKEQARRALLDKLSNGGCYAEIGEELKAMEKNATISERLLDAFPGYYGRCVCLHFSAFLNEPVSTPGQQEAYEEILSFLDSVPPFCMPKDLQDFFEEQTCGISNENLRKVVEDTKHSIENMDEFLSQNASFLQEYLAYRKSPEYLASPAHQLQAFLKEFHQASGYYDQFIPAVKRLSKSYADYSIQMEAANEKLLARYPQIQELDQ